MHSDFGINLWERVEREEKDESEIAGNIAVRKVKVRR